MAYKTYVRNSDSLCHQEHVTCNCRFSRPGEVLAHRRVEELINRSSQVRECGDAGGISADRAILAIHVR
jgi:hypothetical protein